MIKLTRSPKPVELTIELQKKLTKEFKSSKKVVWNLGFIKKALLEFSNNKCCYCETSVNEESKYLEIDHYHHKNTYQDEVMEWENLLPSCKRCNGMKSDHDTKVEPIVNPTVLNPKDHIKYWTYRLKAKNEIGNNTIQVLDLNNADRLVITRFKIGNALQEKMEDLIIKVDNYIKPVIKSTRNKNIIQNGIKKLMQEGIPSSVYSATTSSIILSNKDFYILKDKLVALDFWDEECDFLEKEIINTSFDFES